MLFFSGNLFYIVLYDSQCGKDLYQLQHFITR